MSHQAQTWAAKVRTGDALLKGLLLALANYANEDGECWYSQKRIAFDTEIPERTLRRKLHTLVEMGLIKIIPQFEADGRKANSKIRLISSPATVADGSSTGQNSDPPAAKSGGEPAATWLAEEETSLNHKEPKNLVGKKKSVEYTADFLQSIWQPYPRKTNTSKLNAFKKWVALGDVDQAAVLAAIPAFVISKRGTEEQFIPHLEFFISRRIFETVAVQATSAANEAAVFDRQTWENLSKIYDSSNNWSRQWGPEPGRPGCRMPPDLQSKFVQNGAMH